jgi:serine/threonine-protein kinase
MGQVYRAEHSLLRKTVALKVMAKSVRQSPDGHHRFVREARAAAATKHPHVVDILDIGVLEGMPFIVMEFLEGVDLETYLKRRGVLKEQELADLALPIIAAIGAVHDAGVIHRDIKPSNIFLARGSEEDLVPKVLDFGISKALKGLEEGEFEITGPNDLVGTPLYISPEALAGERHLTPKSDQYSLSVVLYECATGRTPFNGADLSRLVRDVLSGVAAPMRSIRPGISQELEAAVSRAMSRHPEERFDHVRDLGAALWGLASPRAQHVWAKRFSTSSHQRTSRSSGPFSLPGRSASPFSRAALWGGASVLVLLASAAWWYRAGSPVPMGHPVPAVAASSKSPPQASVSASLALKAAAATSPAATPGPERARPASAQTAAESLRAVAPPARITDSPPAAGGFAREGASGTRMHGKPLASRVIGRATKATRATRTGPEASTPEGSHAAAADEIEDLLLLRSRDTSSAEDRELDGLFPQSRRARARPARAAGKSLAGTNESPILD